MLAAQRTVRWALFAEPASHAPAVSTISSLAVLARTLLAIGAIGLLASLLALPAGWILSRSRPRSRRFIPPLAALIAVPLFMPSYLAYAGWGLLRAPQTTLGDWLSEGSNAAVELKFFVANHAIAFWGLALWSYPIAAFTMAIFFRRVSRDLLESYYLDRCTSRPWAGMWLPIRLLLPGVLAAAAMVALVMLGSVVPLDVAQVSTYSIRLLRLVTERERIEEAWAFAWPVYLVAVVAAAGLLRRVTADPTDDPTDNRLPTADRRGWTGRIIPVAVALVWACAVLVPITLFLVHMQGTGPVRAGTSNGVSATSVGEDPVNTTLARVLELSRSFWRESLAGVLVSARTAFAVAFIGVFFSISAWFVASRRATGAHAGFAFQLLRAATLAFLIMGLLPGVLVGSAAAHAWTALPSALRPAPSWFIVVLAHLARFGFVPLLVGWWVAHHEPPLLRDLRRLDGAVHPAAWFSAVFRAKWPHIVGVAVALVALSFHEIEATVFVQPPGPQALSQQLLASLHFARDDFLAAAVVNMLALVGLLGLVVGWLLCPRPDTSVVPRE